MARNGFYVTIGSNLGSGQFSVSSRVGGSDIETTKTALDATIATLVADGATPTQAHVTAANTALTNLTTALAARADVAISYNTATITTLNQLKRAFDEALRQAAASGIT